jgi:hypothetical protein
MAAASEAKWGEQMARGAVKMAVIVGSGEMFWMTHG